MTRRASRSTNASSPIPRRWWRCLRERAAARRRTVFELHVPLADPTRSSAGPCTSSAPASSSSGRGAPPPGVGEQRRRPPARSPRWPLAERPSRSARRRRRAGATSCCPTARRRGATAGRCATRRRSIDGVGASCHRVAARARLAASRSAPTRPTADLAPDQLRRGHPPRRRRRASSPRPVRARPACSPSGPATCSTAGDLPGGARRASSPSTSGPRRRCASAPPTCPALQVRTLNALALAIVNGSQPFAPPAARAARRIDERDVRRILGRLVELPAPAQHRPAGAVARGARRWPGSGCATPSEVEAAYDGDVDGFADVLAALPRRARPPAAPLDFDEQIVGAIELLLTEPGGPPPAPARLPAAAGRRVPGPHARPPAARPAAGRRPTARCSAWATTTRRSTATTAPTRRG